MDPHCVSKGSPQKGSSSIMNNRLKAMSSPDQDSNSSSGEPTSQPSRNLEVYFSQLTDYHEIYSGVDGARIRKRVSEVNSTLLDSRLVMCEAAAAAELYQSLKVSVSSPSSQVLMSKKLKEARDLAIYHATCEAKIVKRLLKEITEVRGLCLEKQKKAKFGRPLRRGQLVNILADTAGIIPLFVDENCEDAEPPPLCGAIPAGPGHVPKLGDLVAALTPLQQDSAIASPSAHPVNNWILCEITRLDSHRGLFDVEDIDEDQKEIPPTYTIPKRNVIALPAMRANPDTHPEALFGEGAIVLALYPKTTCFFKALVRKPPTTALDRYSVLFEDSKYPKGYSPPLSVEQRYVLSYRDAISQIDSGERVATLSMLTNKRMVRHVVEEGEDEEEDLAEENDEEEDDEEDDDEDEGEDYEDEEDSMDGTNSPFSSSDSGSPYSSSGSDSASDSKKGSSLFDSKENSSPLDSKESLSPFDSKESSSPSDSKESSSSFSSFSKEDSSSSDTMDCSSLSDSDEDSFSSGSTSPHI